MPKEDDQHQLWATQQSYVGGHWVHGIAGNPRIYGKEKRIIKKKTSTDKEKSENTTDKSQGKSSPSQKKDKKFKKRKRCNAQTLLMMTPKISMMDCAGHIAQRTVIRLIFLEKIHNKGYSKKSSDPNSSQEFNVLVQTWVRKPLMSSKKKTNIKQGTITFKFSEFSSSKAISW